MSVSFLKKLIGVACFVGMSLAGVAAPLVNPLSNGVDFNTATGLTAPTTVLNFNNFNGNPNGFPTVGSNGDSAILPPAFFAGSNLTLSGGQIYVRNLFNGNALAFGSGQFISNHVNLLGTEPGGGGPTNTPVTFNFASGISQIAFQEAFGAGPFNLTFGLQGGGSEILSFNGTAGGPFSGFASSTPITSLTFSQFNGNFDNLQFQLAPPPPGTPELNQASMLAPLVLVLGGLLVLSDGRRKAPAIHIS